MCDGTGARAGTNKNGVGVHLALGLTGRSGPMGRRRAHTHLLGLTVGADWPAMAAQLAGLPAPALVVLDGETELTALAGQLWPARAIQRCWWHLPHGLRKAFYADDAANRHVNPHWARHMSDQLGELLRDSIRHEQTTEQALATWDAFTQAIPDKLTSAHAYLATARDHAFTCLDPNLRTRLARLGGPELGTGVLERVMREINARTDIGGSRGPVGLILSILLSEHGMDHLLVETHPGACRHPHGDEHTPSPDLICSQDALEPVLLRRREHGPYRATIPPDRPRWTRPATTRAAVRRRP